jgi:predicted secreted Zn-dependent protease
MASTTIIPTLAAMLMAFAVEPAVAEGWTPVEREVNYRVSGTTGPELYASIGDNGPVVGGGRAIAHTTFKLTWRRDYRPRDGGCVLAGARPTLVITYTLPRATARLAEPMRSRWQTFVDGVRRHEKVHGDMIKSMVRDIEKASIGLFVADDPDCRKIRVELTRRLAEISAEQRRQSREFDRVELGDGGAVQKLVLALVNAPQ